MNKYRIFMKNNLPYETGIGNNRHEAINYATNKGIIKANMDSICLIKGNGIQRVIKVV